MAPLFNSIVLSCEHGGNDVPAAYQPLFKGKRRLLDSHRGWDPGTLELGRFLSRKLEVPLIANTETRLLIDMNRSATNPRAFSEITRLLSRAEKQAIIARYYQPHVDALASEIESKIDSTGRVLHLGVHSFTPELNGQRRNADIALLYDPKRAGEVATARQLRESILHQMPNLRFRMNYPYRGTADGLTTILRRRFGAGSYLGIEVEVNQVLVNKQREWRDLKDVILESINPFTRANH